TVSPTFLYPKSPLEIFWIVAGSASFFSTEVDTLPVLPAASVCSTSTLMVPSIQPLKSKAIAVQTPPEQTAELLKVVKPSENVYSPAAVPSVSHVPDRL